MYFVTQEYFPSEVDFWRLTLSFLCVPVEPRDNLHHSQVTWYLSCVCMCSFSHQDGVSLRAGHFFTSQVQCVVVVPGI